MLMLEEIEARRDLIDAEPDLSRLRDHLHQRTRRVHAARPALPKIKGMLTADGGICPADGAPLLFDPYRSGGHRCSRCGTEVAGERHDWWWAWHQHLWMAERIAEAASLSVLAGDDAAGRWAADQALAYAAAYREFPNQDNVLGPSRLFFSTYLESIWLTSYLAGVFLLRESGQLGEDECHEIGLLVDEAAGIIGEFDEGLSNRQTWHNAALAATAVWFEDEELAQRAVEGPRGLVGHLVDGFGSDGLWYEGENYHLFALRGYLIGLEWARLAGADLLEEESARARLAAALLAPVRSALPDGTFPARRDARFGVSLAQPMYLESWERGVALLSAAGREDDARLLGDWLRACYGREAPAAERFDSYLHEAGEAPPQLRSRSALSWWMLTSMAPALPPAGAGVVQGSVLLDEQGLAILRAGTAYASLECGEHGGGHGHPDRLHLTLHAAGVHWLADPGTGSYVAPDLAWYRSTLAHNAPRLDGRSQQLDDADCEAFDTGGSWGWTRGKFGGLMRTAVLGSGHLIDITEFAGEQERVLELPWHPAGRIELLSPGSWQPAALASPFVTEVEQFIPRDPGPVAWSATEGDRVLHGVFDGGGDLLRASGPGRPGESSRRVFLIRRSAGRYVRLVTVLSWEGSVQASFAGSEIVVEGERGKTIHRLTSEGWEVQGGGARVSLKGVRGRPVSAVDLLPHRVGQELWKYVPPSARVPHLSQPPALDGTLDGFPEDAQLVLDHDDQYRRTELPYQGSEHFSAGAHLGWDEGALYLAVEVIHDEPVFRSVDAEPLRLDNEPDLIHADGLQVYLRLQDAPAVGWLVTPDASSTALQVKGVTGPASAEAVRGSWRRTEHGYVVTIAIAPGAWPPAPGDDPPSFDLLVNEMRPGRLRRAGQLIWTGGGGWAYLRGDRADPARFGWLELV
jgi:hypothetical protein